MKINEISKVCVYHIHNDVPGTICELSMRPGSERQSFMDVAHTIFRHIVSLLCGEYVYSEKWDHEAREYIERNEFCVVVPFFDGMGNEIATGTVVRFSHKNWDKDRITGFLNILKAVAALNGWEVEDKRNLSLSPCESCYQKDSCEGFSIQRGTICCYDPNRVP